MKFNTNLLNGFNKWATLVADDTTRIETVWQNGLLVDIRMSEWQLGKLIVTMYKMHEGATWADDGNFVLGENFEFKTQNGQVFTYTTDEILGEIELISPKLRGIVETILR